MDPLRVGGNIKFGTKMGNKLVISDFHMQYGKLNNYTHDESVKL